MCLAVAVVIVVLLLKHWYVGCRGFGQSCLQLSCTEECVASRGGRRYLGRRAFICPEGRGVWSKSRLQGAGCPPTVSVGRKQH